MRISFSSSKWSDFSPSEIPFSYCFIVFLFSFGSVKIPLTVKSKQRNQLQYVRLKTKTKVSCHHLAYKWILISPLQLSRDCSQWTPSSTDADKKIAVTPQAGYRHPSHCLNYRKVRMDKHFRLKIFIWALFGRSLFGFSVTRGSTHQCAFTACVFNEKNQCEVQTFPGWQHMLRMF